MEKISIAMARSIWLFDTNELNPGGKSIFPEALIWLGEKYRFQTFPKTIADIDPEKKGFIFKAGEFHGDDGPKTVNFSFYMDGVVAETWSSTEIGDAFLEDVLRSAAQRFSLSYKPEMVRTKQYINEMNVRLDHSLGNLNSKLEQFRAVLNSIFGRHNLASFEMTGIVFSPDASSSAYKPPGLMIERKLATPFSDNKYWTKAPFTTKDHLFVMEAFEKLLSNE